MQRSWKFPPGAERFATCHLTQCFTLIGWSRLFMNHVNTKGCSKCWGFSSYSDGFCHCCHGDGETVMDHSIIEAEAWFMFVPSKFLCFIVTAVKSAEKETLKSIKLLFLKWTISWVIWLILGSFLQEQTAASGLSLTGFHTSSKAARHDSFSSLTLVEDLWWSKTPNQHGKKRKIEVLITKERLTSPQQPWSRRSCCLLDVMMPTGTSTNAINPKADCLFKQSWLAKF